ncbi:MAG: hypothetical protein OEW48_17190, partial [Phycisphaerae bacterium]|nr:hypothetical protein [Phycisphaerae bacterium]
MTRSILFVLTSILCATTAQALVKPNRRPLELEKYFVPSESTYIEDNKRISVETGRLIAWYGVDKGPFAGTPRKKAEEFIETFADTLEFDSTLTDIEYVRTTRGLGTYHVHFRQTVGGYTINNSHIVISIDSASSKVVMYLGNYHPKVELPKGKAGLTREQALELAKEYLSISDKDIMDYPGNPKIERKITCSRGGNGWIMVYDILISCQGVAFGDWKFLIDVQTGEILEVKDIRK